jgi:nucleotide-binding universal stress UspA family protein
LSSVVEVASCCRCKVVLLRVVYPSGIPCGSVVTPGPAPDLHEKWAMATETEAEAYLDGVARSLREKGLEVESVILRGIPSEVIVRYAEGHGIDLIAIATHRRSGIGRLVFGSVADFVLRELGMPMLVVKPQGGSA